MAPVTPIRTAATLEHRRWSLFDIEVAQLEAVLAYQFARQTWNPIKRYTRKKKAEALHTKANEMLADYRAAFMANKT